MIIHKEVDGKRYIIQKIVGGLKKVYLDEKHETVDHHEDIRMKLIYLAHPYGGKIENELKSITAEYQLIEQHPSDHIFNAVRYFKTYERVLSEPEIMDMCLDMLGRCDELWLSPGWQDSPGCKAELEHATRLGIRVKYLSEVIS